ncbi:MAG TPA: feruloyl-CoA synthase [Steroidobacteraceae bacterium]|nr:feruloyl-CoA synthase [Steroidobacteraceae bacterium]
MTAVAASWTSDAFATQYERRDDGSLILRPVRELAPYSRRLVDSLEHWALAAPERVLVARRDASGSWRQVTYEQMLARVLRLAGGLLSRKLSADRPIAILSGNSIEHLTLALAAMWAGIPYCPVSPAYSLSTGDLSRFRHVMDLLTPGLVAAFDAPRYARALSLVGAEVEIVSSLELLEVEALDQSQAIPQVSEAHSATDADSIVRLLLTSGSTGNPKAVIVTNRMCCSNAAMLQQSMPFVANEPPVLLDWLPWNHTFGGSHNVGLVLTHGGSLYIDDGRPTAAGIAETIRNLREISPTVYFNVPKGFEMLAPHLRDDAALREAFYLRLRAYFFAGASLAQHTWDELDAASMRALGHRTPMLSGLGATETGPSVTFTTPETGRAGVIGLPAAGTLVKLAPVEEKLEIRVRGPAVTPGYWRQPELTAEAFDSEGFYRLGDAVRLIDPEDPTRGLKFDGRIGEDFKLASGTWVSVGPLRAELIAALTPIAQDVVLAGLDADFVTALVIPDVNACASMLASAATPNYPELAREPRLIAWVQQRLVAHARANSASSRCVRRALILPMAPSLDHGEITDKGSINQRAVLRRHEECVAELYSAVPPAHVAVIDLKGSQT